MPRTADPPVRYSDLISKLMSLLRTTKKDGRFSNDELAEIQGAVATLTSVLSEGQSRPVPKI